MNCQQARPLIDPYADGELEATAILELEKHLRDCADCATAFSSLQGLKKAMRSESLYFTAPAGLRRDIKSDLRSRVAPERLWNWNWLSVTASSVAVASLALLFAVTLLRPSTQQRLVQELFSNHVRSLMANHALDVASSDQHTVKPWFTGKLDFSPPVKDLAAQEFPLIGGRLDYVGGRAVAALIFQRHKHVINLFIWPEKEASLKPTAPTSLQGYNLCHWSEGGMTFWAISDLNEKELEEFAEDFKRN